MTEKKIKIVGICGSHRHEQNTWYALKSCLEGIKTLGIPVETELIDLSRMKIEDCRGCHVCFTKAGEGSFCPVIHTPVYDFDSIGAYFGGHTWLDDERIAGFSLEVIWSRLSQGIVS